MQKRTRYRYTVHNVGEDDYDSWKIQPIQSSMTKKQLEMDELKLNSSSSQGLPDSSSTYNTVSTAQECGTRTGYLNNTLCSRIYNHLKAYVPHAIAVSTHNKSARTSSNAWIMATVHDGNIVTKPVQRKGQNGTAPYDQPQALTTTNMFQANHEDAYDSDVDEGPNAAVAYGHIYHQLCNNTSVNEVHSNDNQIFDNVDYQLNQEMLPRKTFRTPMLED
ncbi:hypothetical protein Tco_0530193 [Tanacetum coccineum]